MRLRVLADLLDVDRPERTIDGLDSAEFGSVLKMEVITPSYVRVLEREGVAIHRAPWGPAKRKNSHQGALFSRR